MGGMTNFAPYLIRIGLAVVFLYAAFASFLDPFSWIGFLPSWIKMVVPGGVALIIFSIYEILLSLWLLSGWRIFTAAIFSAGTLFLIIVGNLGALDIIFRDIAILLSAVALAFMHYPNRKVNQ
jgi:hypothetical protein